MKVRKKSMRTIMELSNDVVQKLAKKYERVKQEVGKIMCGPTIETETLIERICDTIKACTPGAEPREIYEKRNS